MITRVAWLVALTTATPLQAQPAAPEVPAEAHEPGPAGTDASDPRAPNDTVLQVVEQPDPEPAVQPMPERPQQHAMPLPTRRSADPALRKARGILAGGILFTILCGAGSALTFVAIVRTKHVSGPRGNNLIAGATGLLACTVGAIGMASYGATRLRKRRHMAEWTGGLGLRF